MSTTRLRSAQAQSRDGALARGDPLAPEYCPHPLHGEFEDCWERHLGFDWLLIRRVEGQDLVFAGPARMRIYSSEGASFLHPLLLVERLRKALR